MSNKGVHLGIGGEKDEDALGRGLHRLGNHFAHSLFVSRVIATLVRAAEVNIAGTMPQRGYHQLCWTGNMAALKNSRKWAKSVDFFSDFFGTVQ
jgi:hypothetical protein